MKPTGLGILAALSLGLAACGGGAGGGGSVVSAPLPPTPAQTPSPAALPPTPATTSGTYQPLAMVQSFEGVEPAGTSAPRQVPAGALTIQIDANSRTYTLTYTGGPFQFAPAQITAPAGSALGTTRNNPLPGTPIEMAQRGDMITRNDPAGTGAGGAIRAQSSWLRLHNVGQLGGSPKYVSAGYWGQFYSENSTGVNSPENFKASQGVMGTMVFGPRTAAADIPVSGNATYRLYDMLGAPLDSRGQDLGVDLDIAFATKTLSASYETETDEINYQYADEENYSLDDDGNPVVLSHSVISLKASGNTKLGEQGEFLLPLSGTGQVHFIKSEEALPADIFGPVNGSLTGALFGPRGAELGGFYELPSMGSDGTTYALTGAFAGMQP